MFKSFRFIFPEFQSLAMANHTWITIFRLQNEVSLAAESSEVSRLNL